MLRSEDDAGLLVVDGVIIASAAPYADVRAAHPARTCVDLRGGVLLPGLVDTHVHYPQVRAIGALGHAAAGVAGPVRAARRRSGWPTRLRPGRSPTEFVFGLVSAGTTTALVFGSHFAPAVDALFAEADRVGLRVTSGLVVSDRRCPARCSPRPNARTTRRSRSPRRWHGRGRLRYAVTPRFSLLRRRRPARRLRGRA